MPPPSGTRRCAATAGLMPAPCAAVHISLSPSRSTTSDDHVVGLTISRPRWRAEIFQVPVLPDDLLALISTERAPVSIGLGLARFRLKDGTVLLPAVAAGRAFLVRPGGVGENRVVDLGARCASRAKPPPSPQTAYVCAARAPRRSRAVSAAVGGLCMLFHLSNRNALGAKPGPAAAGLLHFE